MSKSREILVQHQCSGRGLIQISPTVSHSGFLVPKGQTGNHVGCLITMARPGSLQRVSCTIYLTSKGMASQKIRNKLNTQWSGVASLTVRSSLRGLGKCWQVCQSDLSADTVNILSEACRKVWLRQMTASYAEVDREPCWMSRPGSM